MLVVHTPSLTAEVIALKRWSGFCVTKSRNAFWISVGIFFLKTWPGLTLQNSAGIMAVLPILIPTYPGNLTGLPYLVSKWCWKKNLKCKHYMKQIDIRKHDTWTVHLSLSLSNSCRPASKTKSEMGWGLACGETVTETRTPFRNVRRSLNCRCESFCRCFESLRPRCCIITEMRDPGL